MTTPLEIAAADFGWDMLVKATAAFDHEQLALRVDHMLYCPECDDADCPEGKRLSENAQAARYMRRCCESRRDAGRGPKGEKRP